MFNSPIYREYLIRIKYYMYSIITAVIVWNYSVVLDAPLSTLCISL